MSAGLSGCGSGERSEFPQHGATGSIEVVARACTHQCGELFATQVRSRHHVGQIDEWAVVVTLLLQAVGAVTDTPDVAQADAYAAVGLDRAPCVRAQDARRVGAHAAARGIAYEAGGRIEAHRLGVQERCQEFRRVMSAKPRALVGQHRERRCVRLWKPEVGEPDELGEHGADRRVIYAAIPGAVAKLTPQPQHGVATAFAAHRTAQCLGLARAEPGQRHRDLEHLLLEHHDPEGLAQAVGQQRMVVRRLKVGVATLGVAVLDVGMDGAAADGAGADQRDLDRQVIHGLGLGLQDALNLRAAFDLEHPDRVAVADLLVDGRIVDVDAGQIDGGAAPPGDQVDALLDGRQHAQSQQVDLDEPGVGAGVLVPLHHLTPYERRGYDRHQLHQRSGRHDHAAGVL